MGSDSGGTSHNLREELRDGIQRCFFTVSLSLSPSLSFFLSPSLSPSTNHFSLRAREKRERFTRLLRISHLCEEGRIIQGLGHPLTHSLSYLIVNLSLRDHFKYISLFLIFFLSLSSSLSFFFVCVSLSASLSLSHHRRRYVFKSELGIKAVVNERESDLNSLTHILSLSLPLFPFFFPFHASSFSPSLSQRSRFCSSSFLQYIPHCPLSPFYSTDRMSVTVMFISGLCI